MAKLKGKAKEAFLLRMYNSRMEKAGVKPAKTKKAAKRTSSGEKRLRKPSLHGLRPETRGAELKAYHKKVKASRSEAAKKRVRTMAPKQIKAMLAGAKKQAKGGKTKAVLAWEAIAKARGVSLKGE